MKTHHERVSLLTSILERKLQADTNERAIRWTYLRCVAEGTLRALPEGLRDTFAKEFAEEMNFAAKEAGVTADFHQHVPAILAAIRQDEALQVQQAQKESAIAELIQSAFAISSPVGYAVKYAVKYADPAMALFEDVLAATTLPMAANQPAC